jgi:hypothetical protein
MNINKNLPILIKIEKISFPKNYIKTELFCKEPRIGEYYIIYKNGYILNGNESWRVFNAHKNEDTKDIYKEMEWEIFKLSNGDYYWNPKNNRFDQIDREIIFTLPKAFL